MNKSIIAICILLLLWNMFMLSKIYEARKDFVYIANDCKLLSQKLVASIQRAEIRYQYINNKLAIIESVVKDMQPMEKIKIYGEDSE